MCLNGLTAPGLLLDSCVHFRAQLLLQLVLQIALPFDVEHLQRLRDQQDATKGFSAFICWTFQPDNTKLKANPVGTAEYLRMQALSRVFLDNFENVQSSWVTQGPKLGPVALKYGANDFGSVMMEENVVSKAGTSFRLNSEEIERLIRDAGYAPHRRNNWYELV